MIGIGGGGKSRWCGVGAVGELWEISPLQDRDKIHARAVDHKLAFEFVAAVGLVRAPAAVFNALLNGK